MSQEERKRLDVILEQKDRGKKKKNAAEEAIGVETWQGQKRAL